MGAWRYVVRGKGNPHGFHACSQRSGPRHAADRDQAPLYRCHHEEETRVIECRKDADVNDETPAAHTSSDAMMAAQADLVDVVRTLRQAVCVKG